MKGVLRHSEQVEQTVLPQRAPFYGEEDPNILPRLKSLRIPVEVLLTPEEERDPDAIRATASSQLTYLVPVRLTR